MKLINLLNFKLKYQLMYLNVQVMFALKYIFLYYKQ